MKIELTGKTALVTGSSAGIGFAIAQGLAESGATVVLHGRSAASVDKAKTRLQATVPNAKLLGVAADLGDADGVNQLLAALPCLDIVVNNAGIFEPLDFLCASDDVWERHWQTNVMSGVRLSRAMLPNLMKKGWGRIVFISSESARNIPADMIHYGVSKTALLALSRGLAKRAAGSGVTVNAILPGPTLSDGMVTLLADEVKRTGLSAEALAQGFVKTHRASSVIQRAATVDEVAHLVVYVCSPLSSATSGAALRVDGGVVDDIV